MNLFLKKSYRLSVLKQWLIGNKKNVSFLELLFYLFNFTPDVKAKLKIKKIKIKDGYLVIYFKKLNTPLYYPKDFSKKGLFQIISEQFYSNDWHYYETENTKIDKNDIVVDCGAAEGLFSLIISQRCKKVYAVEPLPNFIASMKLSFSKINNIEIIPFAVADKTKKIFLLADGIYSSISSTNKKGILINGTTLDHLFFEKGIKITFIKADLEGGELLMLNGAKNLIRECKPKIAITTYHNKDHYILISDFLKNINPNYKIKLRGIEGNYGSPVILHAWID
jgi:methyltransferase, FkbM family